MSNNRFAKAFHRFADAVVPSREKLETAYLNQSESIYDLERRMKEIERGRFRGF